MPSENILEAALRRAKIAAGQLPVKSESDEKTGHSYSLSCPGCKATIKLSESDLEQYRTDDETSQTGGDPDESLTDDDQDDTDDEDDPEDRASALAKSLLNASKSSTEKTGSANVGSKVAELKQKYSDRMLNIPEQIMVNRGIDPFEED